MAAPIPPVFSNPAAPVGEPPAEAYSYTAEFLPLAAGATAVTDVGIQADADFYCVSMTAVAGQSDTTPTDYVPVLIQITDSASGATLSDRPIPFSSYFGRGGGKDFYPFRFTPARRFARNGNIRVQAQNLDTTNAYRIRIVFHGYKRLGS
jgi:hypothetical protein